MRTLFTLFFAISLSLTSFSQAIQNAGFENWNNNVYYSEPDGFSTRNIQAYFLSGQGNTTQSSDAQHASSSLRLETIVSGGDTVAGIATVGMAGPLGLYGGVPYTDMPDSLVAYVKYNVMPGDTAVFGIGFKDNGALVGQAFMQFMGSQNTWLRVSAPAQYGTLSVDTLVAIISSSSLEINGVPGSYLMVDNVQLIGASQPFPNQSFENWTDVSVEEPDNWNTLNLFSLLGGPISVTKSTDAHGGNFAARVETIDIDGDTLGFLFNGDLAEDGPHGGMAVNANPKKLNGFYKYTPTGLDTALAGLVAYSYNSTLDSLIPVDSALVQLTSTAGYTSFEVSLTYNGFPPIDTLGILFSASNALEEGFYQGVGSVLLLDDLSLEYFPASVEEVDNSLPIAIYPNPVKSVLYLQYGNIQESISLDIYNLLGARITGKRIDTNGIGSTISINTTDLPNGIYIYKVSVGNRIKTGKIEVTR